MHSKHWVETTFRCLTDDHIGRIQHLYHDKDWSVANRYSVSTSTIYRAVRAVPDHLITRKKSSLRRVS